MVYMRRCAWCVWARVCVMHGECVSRTLERKEVTPRNLTSKGRCPALVTGRGGVRHAFFRVLGTGGGGRQRRGQDTRPMLAHDWPGYKGLQAETPYHPCLLLPHAGSLCVNCKDAELPSCDVAHGLRVGVDQEKKKKRQKKTKILMYIMNSMNA